LTFEYKAQSILNKTYFNFAEATRTKWAIKSAVKKWRKSCLLISVATARTKLP